MEGTIRGIEDGAKVAEAFCLPVYDARRVDVVLHVGCAIVCAFPSSGAWFGVVEGACRVGGLGWRLGVTKVKGTLDERGGRKGWLRLGV